MQKIEVTRVFNASPTAVWERYTDHAGWKDWAGFGHSKLHVPGREEPNGSGAVREFGQGPIKLYEEVIDFDAPKRMTYRVIRGGPMKNHLGEVLFDAEGEGTRVTWRCQFDSKIPGLGGVQRRLVQSFFAKALQGLEKRYFSK